MNKRVITRVWPALAGLLMLAGCGGDEPAAGGEAGPEAQVARQAESTSPPVTPALSTTDIDPCALISTAEIEQILGISVDSGTPESTALPGAVFISCSSDDVHIDVEVWDGADDARGSFELGHDYPPIEGLGQKAVNQQPLGDVSVLNGRYVVGVSLFTELGQETELEKAAEIARVVLGRLP